MFASPRPHWLLGSCLVALVSCKQPPDLSDDLALYREAYNGIVGEYCGCYDSFGFLHFDDCYTAYGDFDDDDAACIENVFEGREELGDDYLACVVPVMEAYDECLIFDECDGEGWHLECLNERDAALADCPTLPAGLAAGFTGCLPGEPL